MKKSLLVLLASTLSLSLPSQAQTSKSALPAGKAVTGVSEQCSKFVTQMSSHFDIKPLSKPGQEYQSYKILFSPEVAAKVPSNDYGIELVCRKPNASFGYFDLLTATIDYNGTQDFHSKMDPAALLAFSKILASAGGTSDQVGQKKLTQCLTAAGKNKTSPTHRTSRYDAGFEDGDGSEFSCFKIEYANSSSYGIAINLGFSFKKAGL